MGEKMREKQISKVEYESSSTMRDQAAASYPMASHTVASWAPPEAPLTMPCQILEQQSLKEGLRVKLASLLFLRQQT